MARSTEVKTKLSLDRWARLMGINPIHFSGIDLPSMRSTHCGLPWVQYEWQQADRVGIEQVARAIQQAEQRLEELLHTRLLPSWEIDEVHATTRPIQSEFWNMSNTDVRGYPQSVRGKWGHFIAGGVRKAVKIKEANLIKYQDTDGDEFKEWCEVVVEEVDDTVLACQIFITPVNEPNAIIRPIKAEINDERTLIIRFPAHLAVKTSVYERYVWEAIDGTKSANFMETVDVYHQYNDPSINGSLYWEPHQQIVSGFIDCKGDPKQSNITYMAANYDATSGAWTRADSLCPSGQPDRIYLNYYAGYRDNYLDCPYRDMAPEIEHIVAAYACTFLEREVCQCQGLADMIKKYTRDLAFQAGVAEDLARYQILPEDLVNPLGTQWGAVQAWKWAQNWRGRVIA